MKAKILKVIPLLLIVMTLWMQTPASSPPEPPELNLISSDPCFYCNGKLVAIWFYAPIFAFYASKV